jgi:hypothetical protein
MGIAIDWQVRLATNCLGQSPLSQSDAIEHRRLTVVILVDTHAEVDLVRTGIRAKRFREAEDWIAICLLNDFKHFKVSTPSTFLSKVGIAHQHTSICCWHRPPRIANLRTWPHSIQVAPAARASNSAHVSQYPPAALKSCAPISDKVYQSVLAFPKFLLTSLWKNCFNARSRMMHHSCSQGLALFISSGNRRRVPALGSQESTLTQVTVHGT